MKYIKSIIPKIMGSLNIMLNRETIRTKIEVDIQRSLLLKPFINEWPRPSPLAGFPWYMDVVSIHLEITGIIERYKKACLSIINLNEEYLKRITTIMPITPITPTRLSFITEILSEHVTPGLIRRASVVSERPSRCSAPVIR